jgi:hypothetical protein
MISADFVHWKKRNTLGVSPFGRRLVGRASDPILVTFVTDFRDEK